MEGEFEDSFSLSSTSDSLHSGSISFGRFEREDLSWERRSSFSHNRYLEEVEKCSKPGSVIEKKAYFEAHFKKRGMRRPGALDSQIGKEDQSENDSSGNVSRKEEEEEEEDNRNESSNYARFDDGVHTEFDCGYARGQSDHFDNSTQCGYFDASLEGSEYCGEYVGMECEREDHSVLTSESQMDAASDNANVVESVVGNMKPQELHPSETGSECSDRQEVRTEEKLNEIGANVDNISRHIDQSPRSETTAEIDDIAVLHKQNHYPKLEVTSESKSFKPRLKSLANASEARKNNDRSKTAVKKQNRREPESPRRKKTEKQPPQAAIPTRGLLLRTPKGEDPETSNLRLDLGNESVSGKEQIKKVAKSQPFGTKKVEHGVLRSPNRFKQTFSTAKTDTRTSTSGFSFRSDERAERRKQFYMKLEEKMHAKEAEMNQVQAKTQEKTEAEIKQFRKSLNFKATPMPSFYHGSASPGCKGNKVTPSKGKPRKTQQKSTSMGNGAATRLQFLSKAKHNHVVAGETAVWHSTEPSKAGEPQPANSTAVNGVAGKEIEKATNLQRYQASENGRISKGNRLEGKAKTRDHRNSREMVRKSVKSVGIGSNSAMGRVAVGVAS